jgi:hypothetical protein
MPGNASIADGNTDLIGFTPGFETGDDLLPDTVNHIDSNPVRIKKAQDLHLEVHEDIVGIFRGMDFIGDGVELFLELKLMLKHPLCRLRSIHLSKKCCHGSRGSLCHHEFILGALALETGTMQFTRNLVILIFRIRGIPGIMSRCPPFAFCKDRSMMSGNPLTVLFFPIKNEAF